MSEDVQTTPQSPTTTTTVGDLSPARPQPSTRIYRIAAGVGIAVGAVIIGGAIFMFGMLIGSQSSADWSDGHGGYGSSDWDPSMFGPDDMAFEGEWLGPGDDGDRGGSEPASPSTAPPVSAR